MQIKRSLVIVGLAVLLLVPFASAGFFDFITGKATGANITLAVQVTSSQPTNFSQVVAGALTVIENTTTNAIVNFTVYDLDGSSDMLLNSGVVRISRDCPFNGLTQRISTSCVNITPAGLTVLYVNFSCQVPFQYYDCAGSWMINASINQTHEPNITYDTSSSLTVDATQSIYISPQYVTFSPLSAGQDNERSIIDNNITNLGNQIPIIKLTAMDLHGQSEPLIVFNASLFKALSMNSSNPYNECSTDADYLINGTEKIIGSEAMNGNRPLLNGDTPNPGRTTEVNYCIPMVPQLIAQNYTTTVGGPWIITADGWTDV